MIFFTENVSTKMIFVGQIFLFSDKLVSNDMAQKRKDSKNTFYSAERMNRDLT